MVNENRTNEQPTQEKLTETDKFFSAARAIVRFCRKIDLSPAETVACLATALAITMRQSNTPFGPDQLKAIELTIQMELDHPVAEATPSLASLRAGSAQTSSNPCSSEPPR